MIHDCLRNVDDESMDGGTARDTREFPQPAQPSQGKFLFHGLIFIANTNILYISGGSVPDHSSL